MASDQEVAGKLCRICGGAECGERRGTVKERLRGLRARYGVTDAQAVAWIGEGKFPLGLPFIEWRVLLGRGDLPEVTEMIGILREQITAVDRCTPLVHPGRRTSMNDLKDHFVGQLAALGVKPEREKEGT